MKDHLAKLAIRPHLPPRTVRLRLTLIYGGLFLVSGAILLGITYLLVRHSTGNLMLFKHTTGPRELLDAPTGLGDLGRVNVPPELMDEAQRLRARAAGQRRDVMEQLLIQSGIALGIMSLVSVALGWLVAGRVLAPLRTMTATTRRISHDNLHERLALDGPNDELKRLADTIDELLARLESAFEAQRRFVANASHELRTPLAMMRTSLDVATGKPGPVPAQVTTLGDKVREGLDQADRLLEGFLALSRAQHGALGDQASVSLAVIVAEAVDARRAAIAEKRIAIRLDTDDVRVRGSETLLAQMVANVVDNAVRHNHPDGWLEASARVDGDLATLVVESSGPRLDERQVQELTQPFRRLGAERTGSENGFGLGLSIVAAVAGAHDGRVALRSRSSGGLRVAIELPQASRAAVARGRAEGAAV